MNWLISKIKLINSYFVDVVKKKSKEKKRRQHRVNNIVDNNDSNNDDDCIFSFFVLSPFYKNVGRFFLFVTG